MAVGLVDFVECLALCLGKSWTQEVRGGAVALHQASLLDYEVALTKAELFRNSDLSDINAWELTLLICTKLNDKEKISEVLFESERFEKYWSGKDKERWKDIRKGFGI